MYEVVRHWYYIRINRVITWTTIRLEHTFNIECLNTSLSPRIHYAKWKINHWYLSEYLLNSTDCWIYDYSTCLWLNDRSGCLEALVNEGELILNLWIYKDKGSWIFYNSWWRYWLWYGLCKLIHNVNRSCLQKLSSMLIARKLKIHHGSLQRP